MTPAQERRVEAAAKRGWRLTPLPMAKERCFGCYDDVYNGQLAKECWSFASAVVVMKKEVSVDQPPPWKQKAKALPDCYRRQRYCYLSADQEWW